MVTGVPERFRRLDALPYAAAYVDSQGEILTANDAFRDLWVRCGAGSDPIEGRTLLGVFAQDEQDSILHTLRTTAYTLRQWSRHAKLAGSFSSTLAKFVPITRRSHAGTLWLVTPGAALGTRDTSEDEAARAAHRSLQDRIPFRSPGSRKRSRS